MSNSDITLSSQMRAMRVFEFTAQIEKLATRKDRTFTLTLNMPEYCDEQAALLSLFQNAEVRVVLEVTELEPVEEHNGHGGRRNGAGRKPKNQESSEQLE